MCRVSLWRNYRVAWILLQNQGLSQLSVLCSWWRTGGRGSSPHFLLGNQSSCGATIHDVPEVFEEVWVWGTDGSSPVKVFLVTTWRSVQPSRDTTPLQICQPGGCCRQQNLFYSRSTLSDGQSCTDGSISDFVEIKQCKTGQTVKHVQPHTPAVHIFK